MEIQDYMGKEQRAYLEAIACLEHIQAQVKAKLPPLPANGTNGTALASYANACEAASTECGLQEAIIAKLDARWALLDWAKGVFVRTLAGDPDLLDILAAFRSAPKNSDTLNELVKLCLELNPQKEIAR